MKFKRNEAVPKFNCISRFSEANTQDVIAYALYEEKYINISIYIYK